jgi:DHA2 family multidrug resistance protein
MLVGIGVILMGVSLYMMTGFAIDQPSRPVIMSGVVQGLGLGLIFVPLTNATMAELEVKDLAQGTGLFNLTRQLGGSLGIAIMATLLSRFNTVEKAMLAEHVVVGDPTAQARLELITRGLIARGVNAVAAPHQALAVLDRQLTAQANVLAFSKIYLLSGILLVAALPLLLLFRTGKGRGSPGSVH